MKAALTILMLFLSALPVTAQDNDFEISAELRVKYFLINDEPDLILSDYRGYNGSANEEAVLAAHFRLFSRVELDLYPYFWHSTENKIARIGLWGEIKYEIWRENLKIGYGHHSWHNADVDTPDNGGRAQDWLLLNWNFLNWEVSDALRLDFSLEPKLFVNNNEPINKKVVYEDDEPEAFGELALRVSASYKLFSAEIRPFGQFASGGYRYGATAEIRFDAHKFLAIFADSNYFITKYESDFSVAVGLIVKFK